MAERDRLGPLAEEARTRARQELNRTRAGTGLQKGWQPAPATLERLAQVRNRLDDPLLVEAHKAVAWVSSRFCRAGMPFERGELEGEAWRAILAAKDRYDPSKGPAVAYFRTIARRAVGKFCSRALAVVSMGKDYAEGAKYQTRLEHQDWQRGEMDPWFADEVREHLEASPERALLAREYEEDRARFIRCVRRAVEEILADWLPYDRFLVQRITGLDGHPVERPRELARRIGCDVRRIYKAHARLEREMWGHTGLVLLHLKGAKESREDR